MILLMVDLRVVDMSGFDVILDMDALIAIGLSVIMTLGGLSYPTQSWSCVGLLIHMVGCVCVWISGRNSFKGGGNVKPRENPNFLKKGKMVISI